MILSNKIFFVKIIFFLIDASYIICRFQARQTRRNSGGGGGGVAEGQPRFDINYCNPPGCNNFLRIKNITLRVFTLSD